MARQRVSREQIELMVAMYCYGLPKEYISKEVGVSVFTVRNYTEVGSPEKFYRDFIKRKGYKSYWEYQKSLKHRKENTD